jgi:excinuclease ABC subunit C
MAGSRLKEKVRNTSGKPGVYMMKNANKKIIYIGKAGNLKKRLMTYFSRDKDKKTRILMENAHYIDTIITANEYEALILENNLIKQWKPFFNINLKDGKSYPAIRITNEDYPRIFRTRNIIFDGSHYFGPYANLGKIDIYLNLIEKIFPLRKCRGKLKKRRNPCLYYHINRCAAPCCGKTTKEEYNKHVENIIKLLNGKTGELVNELNDKMKLLSENLEYEKAALIRDQIDSINDFTGIHQVEDRNMNARDYIGFAETQNLCSFSILQMRKGILTDKKIFSLENYAPYNEALNHFLIQYYSKIHSLPQAVYIPESDKITKTDLESMSGYISEITKTKIEVKMPLRGRHRKNVGLANTNAEEDNKQQYRNQNYRKILNSLKNELNLSDLPVRIEGFDIAHLSGTNTVASMVCFENGRPKKDSYRHFKLRTLQGKIDDFEAMKEIVARRYTRVINDNLEYPDLILVDGGKGQVNAAYSILKSLGLDNIPLAGLAKKNEEIFMHGENKALVLSLTSPALKLLIAVRDESHRFATGFHKKLRKKNLTHSVFENVRGIGKKTSSRIIKAYGTPDTVLKTSPEEISRELSISIKLAEELLDYIRKENE